MWAKYLSSSTNQTSLRCVEQVCKIYRQPFREAKQVSKNSYGFLLLLIQTSISYWGSVSLDSSWCKALWEQKIAADKSQSRVSWTWWGTRRGLNKSMLHYFTQIYWKIAKALIIIQCLLFLRPQSKHQHFMFRKTAATFLKATNRWSDEVKIVTAEITRDISAVTVFCPTSPSLFSRRYTSLCGRMSHSGTGGLCLWKLKRVLHWAMLRACVHLLVNPCMPISGRCITSRKSEAKQNWTLCKQLMTHVWRDHPTRRKLPSIRGGCTDSVLSLWYTANGLCHCLLCSSTTTARCVSLISCNSSKWHGTFSVWIFLWVPNWKKTQLCTFHNEIFSKLKMNAAFYMQRNAISVLNVTKKPLCY